MTNEQLADLLCEAYQDGYRAAMNVITHIITTDRSRDDEVKKDMQERMRAMLKERNL